MIPPPPYDGRHLIADLHGCRGLDDADLIERLLRDAASAAGATVLDVRLHMFGAGQGVTGVALLAESHISIHSWPENGYAAVDFFLCGRKHDLDAALQILIAGLGADTVNCRTLARGYGVIHSPLV